MRKKLIAEIKALAAPHFHESGYRKVLDTSKGIFGGTRPLLLWPVNLELDGYLLRSVIAVTEDGVIDDATGGGAMQADYEAYPIEDLKLLRAALVEAVSSKLAT